MAIRPTELSWANYRKAARILKQTVPGIKPQQIVGRLGYAIKNGQRISITSDGEGGVKQRNRTAHEARNRLYQKRRRIQTSDLSPQQLAENREFKDQTRAGGLEVDHFNEIAFIGAQLEALEKSGGDVQAALQRLRDAGYALGDDPRNLQALSPDDNKAKNQQNKALQNYLGSREALGQSPSARNTNLIVTGEDLSTRQTQFPGTQQQPGIQTTAGKVEFKPGPLGGFVPEERTPYVTPPSPKYVPPLVQQYSYQTNGNGNGNGNGATPPNGNGGSDNGLTDQGYQLPEVDYEALQRIVVGTAALAGGVIVEAGKVFMQGGYQ